MKRESYMDMKILFIIFSIETMMVYVFMDNKIRYRLFRSTILNIINKLV